MREADDEAMKMRDQLQADSHLLAREQREKQALERQLEDANFECRKIAVLQHRVDTARRSTHRPNAGRGNASTAG